MNIMNLTFPPTTLRVERSTSHKINARIERATIERIARAIEAGPDAIERRLEELDREWDMERMLETNASIVSLIGLGLGTFVNPKWFRLPAAVAAFLLQHAIQGWCPPIPVLRRLGFRSEHEIHLERTALRIARGDFRESPSEPLAAFKMAKGPDRDMRFGTS
jgi:hypothetical protein